MTTRHCIRREGDEYACSCGLRWGVNDIDPHVELRKKQKKEVGKQALDNIKQILTAHWGGFFMPATCNWRRRHYRGGLCSRYESKNTLVLHRWRGMLETLVYQELEVILPHYPLNSHTRGTITLYYSLCSRYVYLYILSFFTTLYIL